MTCGPSLRRHLARLASLPGANDGERRDLDVIHVFGCNRRHLVGRTH